MRYFEFSEPYYALIQAEDLAVAVAAYLQTVCDEVDEEPTEISRDRALLVFSRGLAEGGEELSVDEQLTEFYAEDNQLLLVDGALL